MRETEHYHGIGAMIRCGHCPAETRTERGMLLHLAVCHGLRLLSTFAPKDAAPDAAPADLPRTVRQ